MDVLFKQVRGYSGTDVWTDTLSSSLQKHGVASQVSYFPSYVGYIPYLAKLLDKSRDSSSIVHGNTWNAFAFKDSNPMVATEHHVVHDSKFEPYKTLAQKMYHKIIYQYESKSLEMADCVICVSEYTKDRLEQVFEYSDAQVIYNGVDEETFQPQYITREFFCKRFGIPDNKTILLFVGNPTNRKGADLLPKIMRQLDDSFILIMTSGLRGNEIDTRNIKSIGRLPVQDLVNLYTLSDIFLFPTRLEGFGLVVAEAMACEKPVVSTNCSAIPELVHHDKGGFLCDMDNVKQFVTSVQYLSDDIIERERMGHYTRCQIINNFSLNIMTKRYIQLYSKLA